MLAWLVYYRYDARSENHGKNTCRIAQLSSRIVNTMYLPLSHQTSARCCSWSSKFLPASSFGTKWMLLNIITSGRPVFR